jgi:hypothetical protein
MFTCLFFTDHQDRISSAPTCDSKKFVLNFSKHTVTDSEEAVFVKCLNFLITFPHSNLDKTYASEYVLKLPQTQGMELGGDIVHVTEV